MNKVYILIFGAISLAIFGGACSTAANGANGNVSNTNTGAATASAGAEAAATPSSTSAMPSFKKGDDYKKTVRPALIKDGWKPQRTSEGDENCEGAGDLCKEMPELEAGPASGMGNMDMRWVKGKSVIHIFTVGEEPVFDAIEAEKAAKDAPGSDKITGNYSYADTETKSAISFSFYDGGKVEYELWLNDQKHEGNGTWKWSKPDGGFIIIVPTWNPNGATPESKGMDTYVVKRADKGIKIIQAPAGLTPLEGSVLIR